MTGTVVYSRAQLIALCKPQLLPGDRPVIPVELRRRARGCRSGAKTRAKKMKYKTLDTGDHNREREVLANKTDELGALVMTEDLP